MNVFDTANVRCALFAERTLPSPDHQCLVASGKSFQAVSGNNSWGHSFTGSFINNSRGHSFINNSRGHSLYVGKWKLLDNNVILSHF